MGANEVAPFYPIFFFDDSNVDEMFWAWQENMGKQIILISTQKIRIHQGHTYQANALHHIKHLDNNYQWRPYYAHLVKNVRIA